MMTIVFARSITLSRAFALALVLLLTDTHRANAEEFPTELVVSGEATAIIESEYAVLELLSSAEGQTATQALEQTRSARNNLLKALASAKLDHALVAQEAQLSSADKAELSSGSIVVAKDFFNVRTNSLGELAKVVDLALASNCTLLGLRYESAADSKQKKKLISKATAQAQEKARDMALQLGVELGALLSAAVSEEPAAAMLLDARRQGGPALLRQQQPERVLVSLRYAIKAPAGK